MHWQLHQQRLAARSLAERRLAAHPMALWTQQGVDLAVDFSRQNMDELLWKDLWQFAEQQNIGQYQNEMFAEKTHNITENRAVTHWQWRMPNPPPIIAAENQRLAAWIAALPDYEPSGAPITDILHLGIGGSDLGPRMVAESIAYCQTQRHRFQTHFVSNVDGHELQTILEKITPKNTIITIASKTFRTRETLRNANTVFSWLQNNGIEQPYRHCVGLTSDPQGAQAWGLAASNIFEFAESVGGRFSVWSPIGLPARLTLGEAAWREFLAGGAAADQHIQTHTHSTKIQNNLALKLALVDFWNHSICELPGRVLAPYDARLGQFSCYIQQLEMESLGKNHQINGEKLRQLPCPMIWGEPGTNGQHAYYQWLHQGGLNVAIEFFVIAQGQHDYPEHQAIMLSNALAQADAFAYGKRPLSMKYDQLDYLKILPGGKPVTVWCLQKLSPFLLGFVLAILEYKVIYLAKLLNINPFDQYGVELGKQMAAEFEKLFLDKNIKNNMHIPANLHSPALSWLLNNFK